MLDVRARVKIVGGSHTAMVERKINDWIRKVEEQGYRPVILREEIIVKLSTAPATGKTKVYVVAYLLYTLKPLDTAEDSELDYDSIVEV